MTNYPFNFINWEYNFFSMKYSKILFTIALFLIILTNLYSQETYANNFSISIEAQDGLLASQEPGYDLLFQNNFNILFGFKYGYPLAINANIGYFSISNSNIAADWYRYRGYDGIKSLIGVSYSNIPFINKTFITGFFRAGGNIAKYYYSDSYFFFPEINFGLSYPLINHAKSFVVGLGCYVPVFFRVDSTNYGFTLMMNIQWSPKGNMKL